VVKSGFACFHATFPYHTMTSLGTRLNEERVRLGLTQTAMAELGGVKQNTQRAYEQDRQTPTTEYLQRLMASDLDVMYLFYGVRFKVAESKETAEILAAISQLSESQRGAAFALLSLFGKASALEQQQPGGAQGFWRAARLFGLFVELTEKEQTVLERTATHLAATRKR
jgi:transcriptional regulator with XRE-family HTH domain